jgi:hypothetical protein
LTEKLTETINPPISEIKQQDREVSCVNQSKTKTSYFFADLPAAIFSGRPLSGRPACSSVAAGTGFA